MFFVESSAKAGCLSLKALQTYKQDCLQESESFHLNSSSFQSLVSCGLAGLPHVPVFSRVGGDEMNRMKVKVLSLFLDLIVNFS